MQNSVFASHRFTAPPLELSGSNHTASCRLFDDADDDDFSVPVTPFLANGSRAQRQRTSAHSYSSMGATGDGTNSTSSYGHHSSSPDFMSQQNSTHCRGFSQGRSSGSTLEYLESTEEMMKIVIAPKPAEAPLMRVVVQLYGGGVPPPARVAVDCDNEEYSATLAATGGHLGPATAVEDGFATEIGPRKNQEDNYVARLEKKLWAVFDGHRGHASSSFAASFLADHISGTSSHNTCGGGELDLCQQLALDVSHLEASMKASAVGEADGTTACIAMIAADGALRVANVGDSRAVFADRHGDIHFVTGDHKNSCSFEAQRIADDLRLHREREERVRSEVAGEAPTISEQNGAHSDSDLSVTRALGDFDIKQRHIGLSSMVDIYEAFAVPGDVLIIASDGVWDVIKPQEAISIVLEELGLTSAHTQADDSESPPITCASNNATPRNGPRCAAQALVRAALDRRTGDNCTAVVVKFKW
jgi:serine/threonine protein phosphatase PrpC